MVKMRQFGTGLAGILALIHGSNAAKITRIVYVPTNVVVETQATTTLTTVAFVDGKQRQVAAVVVQPVTYTVASQAPSASIISESEVQVNLEACPQRKGSGPPKSSAGLWGCPGGTICSPKDRCWFEPMPARNFVCDPEDCVPAPPTFARKDEIQLPYYPLDPVRFGLDYSVFKAVYTQNRRVSVKYKAKLKARQELIEGDDVYGECFTGCNEANLEGQSFVSNQRGCTEEFRSKWDVCKDCLSRAAERAEVRAPPFTELVPEVIPFIEICESEATAPLPVQPPTRPPVLNLTTTTVVPSTTVTSIFTTWTPPKTTLRPTTISLSVIAPGASSSIVTTINGTTITAPVFPTNTDTDPDRPPVLIGGATTISPNFAVIFSSVTVLLTAVFFWAN